VDQIRAFEEFLHRSSSGATPQLLAEIANKKELSDELRETLTKAIDEAKTEFAARRASRPPRTARMATLRDIKRRISPSSRRRRSRRP
jgi:hypothetical protein